MPLVIGGDNLPSLDGIGLNDLDSGPPPPGSGIPGSMLSYIAAANGYLKLC